MWVTTEEICIRGAPYTGCKQLAYVESPLPFSLCFCFSDLGEWPCPSYNFVTFLRLVSCMATAVPPPPVRRKYIYSIITNLPLATSLDCTIYFFQAPGDTWGLNR